MALYPFGERMKIIDWLGRQWKNFKFELNLSTPEEIEVDYSINNRRVVKTRTKNGEIISQEDIGPLKYPRESKGEEQKEIKKETFESKVKEVLREIRLNQEAIYFNQQRDREELKKQEERIIEIIKMLMDIKDKL